MFTRARPFSAAILCSVLAFSAMSVVITPRTADALSPHVSFSAEGLSTWQTNGVVWGMSASRGKVVAGGTFSQLRAPEGGSGAPVSLTGLAILDGETGAPDVCQLPVSFSSGATPSVRAVVTSDDGDTVYVAGNFGQIGGQTTGRVAAIDVETCTVRPFRVDGINSWIHTLAISGNTLYFGGEFTDVGGVARQRFAAVNATTGALLPWKADVDATGRGIGVSPDGTKVAIGGDFFNINGAASHSIAVVDGTTGANLRTYSTTFIEPRSITRGITSSEDRFYVSNEGTGGGVFDGRLAISWETLDQVWRDTCLGATQATLEYEGALYAASHSHNCSADGVQNGFPDGRRNFFTAQDPVTADHFGWDPRANDGIGEGIGPRALTTVVGRTTGKTYLWSGGEFTLINGSPQQGLTRFGPDDTNPPPTPGVVVEATSEGAIQVRWRSVVDSDDSELTYSVYRNGAPEPVWVTQSSSVWWKRPQLSFIDTAVVPGNSYTYRVKASDGTNTSALSNGVAGVATAPSSTYRSTVRADQPSMYLDMSRYGPEPLWLPEVGANTSDSRRINGLLSYYPPNSSDSPLPSDPSGSTDFNGTSQFGWSDEFVNGPQTYSIETWVKTTAGNGGLLVGYGNGRPYTDSQRLNKSSPGKFDRLLYLEATGQVRFGAGALRQAIRSTQSVNDGQWHHIVATQDSDELVLYIDGGRAARTPATADNTPMVYRGGWHLAADNLEGWPNKPSAIYFNGKLDEVAIYPTALDRHAVGAHFTAAGGTPAVNPRPTDTYGGDTFDTDPELYWRLGETSGTTAADSSYFGVNPGTYGSAVTKNTVGIPSQSGTGGDRAVTLPGTTSGTLTTKTTVTPPKVFSAEVWFKTTTTKGGKILGFENTLTGSGSVTDKNLFMQNNGKLSFGTASGGYQIITSPSSYNDGDWHHAVAQIGPNGRELFVDGASVASSTSTAAQTTDGYWRLGGGNLANWPGRPTSDYFAGAIDEAAIYLKTLSSGTVLRHYSLGLGDTEPPTVPAGLAATQSGGDVTLTWTASTDNVALDRYRVFRGLTAAFEPDETNQVGTSTEPTFTEAPPAGPFYYKVIADDGVPNSSAPSAALSVDVLDSSGPTKPADLAATSSGPGAVTLTWSESTDDVAVTGYRVYRGLTAGFPPSAGTLVATTGTTPTFADTEVARGDYFYKVVAFDAAANVSPASDAAAVTVPDHVAPTTPGGVTTSVASGQVTISWTASTDDVAVEDYQVHRGTTASFVAGPATLVGESTSLSYSDIPPASGTFYYRVVARDAAGNASAPSAAVAATAVVPDETAPSVPDDLAATVDGGSVSLTWAEATDNEAVVGYRLFRGETAGFTPAAGNRLVEQATRSYVDAGRPLGTFYYKVVAYDAAGNVSDASPALEVVVGTTTIVVGPSVDARVHSVQSGTNLGTDVQLAATGGGWPMWSLLKFELPVAPPGTTLAGVRLGLRTSGDPTAGSVDPFDVFVTTNGWTETGVTWNNRPMTQGAKVATLTGATGVNTAYTLVGDPSALADSVGSTVSLRISGREGVTDNLRLWSREAAAEYRPTLTLIYAPGGDTSAPSVPVVSPTVEGSDVTVSWPSSTDDVGVTGYSVYRGSTAAFVAEASSKVADVSVPSYRDAGRPAGTYYYKVVAFDAAGNRSAASTAVSALVADVQAPTTPTDLAATRSGADKAALTWTVSTDDVGVTNYRIYRGTTAGFTVNSSSLVGQSASASYLDIPPATGTYYYRVVARDAAGNASDPSGVAAVLIGDNDTDAPTAPNDLASTVDGASVTVTWSAAVDNVGVTGYRVHRGTTPGFTPAAGNLLVDQATRSFVDAGRPLGTSYYKVVAYDAAGNVGAASAALEVVVGTTTIVVGPTVDARVHSVQADSTLGTDVQLAATGGGWPMWSLMKFEVPAAPPGTTLSGVRMGLRTSGDPTAGSVDPFDIYVTTNGWSETGVTWNNRPLEQGAKVATLTGATGVNTAYTLVGDPSALAGSVGSTVSLRISGREGVTDNLRLWSRESSAEYAPTLTLIYAPGGDATAPSVPVVSTSVDGGDVTVNWPNSTDDVGVTGYSVYRGATAGFVADDSSKLADVTASRYVDAGRPAGTSFYKVVAFDAAGNRSAASTASSATVADVDAPTKPADLTATKSGADRVALSWTASTDNVAVTAYRLYRGTTSGFTVDAASLVAQSSSTSYLDSPPATGTYYYRVVARDAAGNDSAPSGVAAVLLGDTDTDAPTVPDDLASTVDGASVTLTWSAAVDNVGVTGYRLFRGTTAGFTPAAGNRLVDQATRSYVDTGRPVGTYYYKVVAYDAAGNVSAASAAHEVAVVAKTVEVVPTADARVIKPAPNSNYGTDQQVAATGGGDVIESLLRFDLPAAPTGQTLTGVSVTVRTSGDPTAGSIHPYALSIVTGAWAEDTVTWNNRPTNVGAKVADLTGLTEVNAPITATGVPAALVGSLGESVTLLLDGPATSTDNLRLWSREGPAQYRPTLTLTYS